MPPVPPLAPVFPEMVLAMTVITPLLLMPAPKLKVAVFPEIVLSMTVMVPLPLLVMPLGLADMVLSVMLRVPKLLMPTCPPCWIVRSWRFTPVTPPSTVTTDDPLDVPSRTPREPSGPPGHLVMVTGDLMVTSWSLIVPETLMVAPEAARVRAWLTVAHGLADVQGALSEPPCDTYKVFGAAAWAAAGANTPKASTTAPAATAARLMSLSSRIATPHIRPDGHCWRG